MTNIHTQLRFREFSRLQKQFKINLASNPNLIKRLEYISLEKHAGCVNTVQWNYEGTLLVSGSDDCYVSNYKFSNIKLKIWKPFERKLVTSIRTGHTGNIFHAFFFPFTGDKQLVSCAADGQIRVYDISDDSKPVIRVYKVHRDMVHKLDLEPGSPYVFLSASQDGTVRLFDIREKGQQHTILVDLRRKRNSTFKKHVGIDSISINPLNPNYFVIGGGDPYIRLYDRRMIKKNNKCQCVKKFVPESLLKKKNHVVPIHITGVRYNCFGNKVIGTYSGDKIYLFDTTTPDRVDQDEMDTKELKIEEHEMNDPTSDEDDYSDDINESDEEEQEPDEAIKEGVTVKNYLYCYSGHINIETVKEVNFFGPKSEYVISGSDCGNIFFWDVNTTKLVNIVKGDKHVVNCLAPHPDSSLPIIATSGIEYDVKVFMPTSESLISKEMERKDEILSDNEKRNREGPRWDTQIVLNFIQMISDDGTDSNQRGERVRRILAQIMEEDSDEEQEEEGRQRTHRCTTS